MEVLTAYVRKNAAWKDSKEASSEVSDDRGETPSDAAQPAPEIPEPPIDIQAILTVLGRRELDEEREQDHQLNLAATDLRRADLPETHLEGANLREAHLQGANFWHAHLEHAYLDNAHLEEAQLFDTHLEGTHLSGARLEGAFLLYAHLEGAYLFDAYLEGTHLENAHLKGVLGLTQEQLDKARGNSVTALPAHLERPSHWPAKTTSGPPTPA